jgi:hypothetical protein
MNSPAFLDWSQHSETKETTISNDEWSRDRRREVDFDVPKSLLRETCPWGKCLHSLTIGLEWFALHSDSCDVSTQI